MFDFEIDDDALPTVEAPFLADTTVPALYRDFHRAYDEEDIEIARAYAREANHDRGFA